MCNYIITWSRRLSARCSRPADKQRDGHTDRETDRQKEILTDREV